MRDYVMRTVLKAGRRELLHVFAQTSTGKVYFII